MKLALCLIALLCFGLAATIVALLRTLEELHSARELCELLMRRKL